MLHSRAMVTDGGLETDLIYHHGLRCIASTLSHAALDEATELEAGDPTGFAQDHNQLGVRLPEVRILGGCCGTDTRHVAVLWGVDPDAEQVDQRAKAG